MHKQKTLVVGLGKTGLSIARYLSMHHVDFMIFDTREAPEDLKAAQEEFSNVPIYVKTYHKAWLSDLELIITSPGVSHDHPLFHDACALGIPVIGDVELFARVVSAPIIAITGTNGKSTVTSLVGEMARAAGRCVGVAGNIGTPVLEALRHNTHYDLWVLELSSFQLELTENLTPWIGTILNISPDHLDRHGSMAAYWAAKQRVYANAHQALFYREDQETCPDASIVEKSTKCFSYGLSKAPDSLSFGLLEDEGGRLWITQGSRYIFPVDDLKIKGKHNWLNAMAACALASSVEISDAVMQEVLSTFSGLPHRCQWVRSFKNVGWIDDSKGTNVGATISAMKGIGDTLKGKIILIAGGQGKGADFSMLRPAVQSYVRSVITLGQDAFKIEEALRDVVPVLKVSSLESAVLCASEQAHEGDIVLLSPACASLDMFRDYHHRGEIFSQAVEAL